MRVSGKTLCAKFPRVDGREGSSEGARGHGGEPFRFYIAGSGHSDRFAHEDLYRQFMYGFINAGEKRARAGSRRSTR